MRSAVWFVCAVSRISVTAAVQSLFLCLGVMFDWDIIYHRRETSSLYLWKAACTHQTLLMTSARVRVSRVIRADEHVQRACTSNNRVVRRCVWSTYMRVCPLACTHTALLLRLLNYEAFGAVVMAPSAFGNMSFYFRLGPNIQFEESSQTIHDLFKRATRGKDEYPWEVTHLTDWSWRQVLFCVFFLICGSWWCWWWWGQCVRWRWVCFVCHLPAGERLSTGVPWSGAARVHDLQPREVREQKSSRPSITRAKSRGFFFLFNAARMKLATISVILLERMQRTETFLPLALFAL